MCISSVFLCEFSISCAKIVANATKCGAMTKIVDVDNLLEVVDFRVDKL